MERLVGGERLTDLEAVRRIMATDPETMLINALNTWFGSLLACDSFHADLHAGRSALASCLPACRLCLPACLSPVACLLFPTVQGRAGGERRTEAGRAGEGREGAEREGRERGKGREGEGGRESDGRGREKGV